MEAVSNLRPPSYPKPFTLLETWPSFDPEGGKTELPGETVRKVIVVKGKLVNIVV